jgi:predicted RNase H-like HicB family nuclease
VDFPDFPDIITSGRTLTEAFANACEALDLHLESLQKLNRRVPRPKHRFEDVQPPEFDCYNAGQAGPTGPTRVR